MAANSWERQASESAIAFEAFVVYRDLGPNRSVVAAYRQSRGKEAANQASGEWNKWASVNRWEKRASAWDAHLQAVRDKIRLADEARWERRAARHREKHWRINQAAIGRLVEMLKRPLEEIVEKQDGKIIIHAPAGWSYKDIATLQKNTLEIGNQLLNPGGEPIKLDEGHQPIKTVEIIQPPDA